MTDRVDWQYAVRVPGVQETHLGKGGWLTYKGTDVVVDKDPVIFDDQGTADKGLRMLQEAHQRLGLTCQAEVVARKVTTTIGEWAQYEDVG